MILVLILVIFGAINTILLKMQNIQVINQHDGKDLTFFHPFIQTALAFFGEILIGFVILIRKFVIKSKQEITNLPKAPYYIVLFPAFMDLLATILSCVALNMVDSSVWQISRGGNIITAAILSKILLKRVYTNKALLGCVIAFIGITGVQVVTILFTNKSDEQRTIQDQLIGIGLLLVSIFFNGMSIVAQKWIFNKYQISPLKMVFLEGIYGIIMMIPIAFSFQYISCPWSNKSNCVFNGEDYYLQSISNFWNQITNNSFLLILVLGLIISMSISVPIAVTVSKNISPVSRSLADVSRTIIIWLFGIILTLTYGTDHEQYRIQKTQWLINVLKAIGFSVLMFGTLLYHDLLPCFSKKKQQLRDSLLETESYVGSQRSMSFNQSKE